MKANFTKLAGILLSATLLLSGCASSYRSIHPETMQYGNRSESQGVELSYKYNVLRELNNKKYAKKENNRFTHVVAVKITNNSDQAINLSNDVHYFMGNTEFTPLAPEHTHSSLKQGVPIYLLYLLFTPMTVTRTESGTGYQNGGVSTYTNSTTTRVGLILGPALTAYNLIKAGSANQKFKHDLQNYSIQNKQLLPGETTYGLIGVANSSYNPISIQVGDNFTKGQQ